MLRFYKNPKNDGFRCNQLDELSKISHKFLEIHYKINPDEANVNKRSVHSVLTVNFVYAKKKKYN